MQCGAVRCGAVRCGAVQRCLFEGITGFTDRADLNWCNGTYAEMAGCTSVARAFNDAGVWRM